MLNRLVKNVWDLDSFIEEVQNKYPNSFSKEALEVIFDNLEDYPGYCCVEELTEEFEEWTNQKFVDFVKNKYQENVKPEEVWEFIRNNFTGTGEDMDENIIRVLNSTVLIHPDFGLYNS